MIYRTPHRERTIDWKALDDCLTGKSRKRNAANWPVFYPSCQYQRNCLWVVYGLAKPGEEIRYVGITRNNPADRLGAHAHGGSKAKKLWFNTGPRPKMYILSSLRGTIRDAIEVEVTLSKALMTAGNRMINRECRFVS